MNELCHIWMSHVTCRDSILDHPYCRAPISQVLPQKVCIFKIHTYVYTYIYIYVYICTRENAHIACLSLIHSPFLSLCLCIYMPQDLYILRTHICRCTYLYIYVYIYMHIYTYIDSLSHTHTCTRAHTLSLCTRTRTHSLSLS